MVPATFCLLDRLCVGDRYSVIEKEKTLYHVKNT